MRRIAVVAGVLVVALAACVGLVAVLASRDSGEVGARSGPGVLEPDRGSATVGADAPATPASAPADPPTSGPHRAVALAEDGVALSDDELLTALAQGNVVLTYPGARAPAELVAVQADVSGPFDPSLAEAGQAVILARRPGAGVLGLAWRRRLVASGPGDPGLREFADAWLGQGAAAG